MWFDSWSTLLRTAVAGIIAYAALVVFLRVSGKRTLAKMNAFDLVVTVALGSTLATVLLSKDVSIVDGLFALALLIGLQYVVALATSRWRWMRRIVKSTPVAVMAEGVIDHGAMKRERLSDDEVLAAIRASGHADLDDVATVVLETDGSLSVVPKEPKAPAESAIRDVRSSKSCRIRLTGE